jgi:hypothetical protein
VEDWLVGVLFSEPTHKYDFFWTAFIFLVCRRMYREPARWLTAASLLYATYVVLKCPCDVLASCQQTEFYTATIAPLVIVATMNANRIV